MSICAILLAAGESSRMGEPKPLLDWFGAPLVRRQAEALLEAGVHAVFAVTGNQAEAVANAVSGVPGVHAVHNPAYLDGKTTSIKAGLAALPADAEIIVLLAVDQPRPAWLIRQVLDAHRSSGALISSPVYDGHGGHPLVFAAAALRGELSAITEDGQGVRQVMRAHAAGLNRVEVNTPLARLDMNTPGDVEEARKLFSAGRTA